MQLSRFIEMEKVPNCRDLGGIKNVNGRNVRSHLILRTSYLMNASEKDIETLKKEGITDILDFRGDNEFAKYPDPKIDGVIIHRLPMHLLNRGGWNNNVHYPHKSYLAEHDQLDYLQEWLYVYGDCSADALMENCYREIISDPEVQKQWGELFHILLNSKGALAFHCQDGKDRTGVAAMLILKLLEVDDKTVVEEYVLSKKYLSQKIERDYKQCLDHNVPEPVLSELKKVDGSERNWMESALKEFHRLGGYPTYFIDKLGLTKEEIKAFQDKYLD